MARQAQPKEAERSREVLHSIRLCEVGEEYSPIPGEAHWTLAEGRGLGRMEEAERHMTERTEDHRRLAAVAEAHRTAGSGELAHHHLSRVMSNPLS